MRPRLVAGNWKMNGLAASVTEALAVKDALSGPLSGLEADVMIAPPATLLKFMSACCGEDGRIQFAGQDCHAKASGVHTGDVSAEMLREASASAVIVGHSERRADHGETSAEVRAKAEAAHRAGLAAIVCIGETAGERSAGLTLAVVRRQLAQSLPDGGTAANLIVAYEPVWAIGTGRNATPEQAQAVHAFLRGKVPSGTPILYGGSVKPQNAAAIFAMPDVDGGLIGGASLVARDFLDIVKAAST